MFKRLCLLAAAAILAGTTATFAQSEEPESTGPAPATAPEKSADSLSIYFDVGSASVSAEGQGVLDQAARTYRDGKPIIMVVSGGSDATGSAALNLRLSQLRADNVVHGLVARGIPVERFQVLAKGQTEPPVPAPEGTAEQRNRRVEITWR